MTPIRRRIASWVAIVGLLTSGTFISVSCNAALMDRFRVASADSLEAGVKDITNGVIEGLFALFVPESASGSASGA